MIIAPDTSNVGEFSRTWGYILDKKLDRFFQYPDIMYIIYTGTGFSMFGIAMVMDRE
jgi:hypothetical protein